MPGKNPISRVLDRLLGRRPTIAIANAADGTEVRIGGTVSCASPLVAPYSGRACVYWRLEFMQQAFENSWAGSAFDATDFTIEDGTGRAEVIVEVCAFDVVANFVEMERATHLSQKARELSLRYEWGAFADVAQVEILEAIVAVGEDIEVAGTGTREPELREVGERGYRDELSASRLTFSRGTRVRGKQRDAVFIRTSQTPMR